MDNTNLHPHLTRQMDLIPIDVLGQAIHVIGAGAVGSCTVMALAKMGFENISVWDHDTIEVENMSSQFYRFSDIGQHKVAALKDIILQFAGIHLETYAEKYTGAFTLPGIVIAAVDSMAVRQTIWDTHKGKGIRTKLLIDPRMGAETALVYAMKVMSPADIVSYEKTLYTDENAEHEKCTAKATSYTAFMLSGHVAKIVKDFVCGKPYSRVTQWSIAENDFTAFPAEA